MEEINFQKNNVIHMKLKFLFRETAKSWEHTKISHSPYLLLMGLDNESEGFLYFLTNFPTTRYIEWIKYIVKKL